MQLHIISVIVIDDNNIIIIYHYWSDNLTPIMNLLWIFAWSILLIIKKKEMEQY